MSSQPTNKQSATGYGVSDLTFVFAAATLMAAVVVFDGPPVVRIPLGIVSVLVLPGYALTAALFPRGPTTLPDEQSALGIQSPQQGISLIERAVLSVGSSLALVVVSGLVLGRFLGDVSTETLLAGVLTITLLSVIIAMGSRRRVPNENRYAPSVSLGSIRAASRPTALTVVVAVSVLFAGGAVAYAELGDDQSASITELYFVGDSDAADRDETYPTTFVRGEPQPVSIAVSNSEGHETTYTVIGELQEVDQQDGAVIVENRTELSREQVSLADGETHQLNTTVEPDLDSSNVTSDNATSGNATATNVTSNNETADEYRLVYLLYRGDPPQEPQIANAYREIHLWITVVDPPIAGETDDPIAGETDNSTAGETDDPIAGETDNSTAGETDDV